MWCKLRDADYVTQIMWSKVCDAKSVMQIIRCKLMQSMWSKLWCKSYDANYVTQIMWRKLCDANYVTQIIWRNILTTSHDREWSPLMISMTFRQCHMTRGDVTKSLVRYRWCCDVMDDVILMSWLWMILSHSTLAWSVTSDAIWSFMMSHNLGCTKWCKYH